METKPYRRCLENIAKMKKLLKRKIELYSELEFVLAIEMETGIDHKEWESVRFVPRRLTKAEEKTLLEQSSERFRFRRDTKEFAEEYVNHLETKDGKKVSFTPIRRVKKRG